MSAHIFNGWGAGDYWQDLQLGVSADVINLGSGT
jgi:hypothetical protein